VAEGDQVPPTTKPAVMLSQEKDASLKRYRAREKRKGKKKIRHQSKRAYYPIKKRGKGPRLTSGSATTKKGKKSLSDAEKKRGRKPIPEGPCRSFSTPPPEKRKKIGTRLGLGKGKRKGRGGKRDYYLGSVIV